MTTQLDDSVDTLEIVDLEALFNQEVPCDYEQRDGCKNPAKWRATLQSCGHRFNVCTPHRGKMLAALSGRQDWRCASTSLPITNATWEPL